MGRLGAAKPLQKERLEIARKALSAGRLSMLTALGNYAGTLSKLGHLSKADLLQKEDRQI